MTTTIVSPGTTSSNLVVSSGNTLVISSGGVVSGLTVLAGGIVQAAASGILKGAISDAGLISGGSIGSGTIQVLAGGVTSSVTLTSGATEILSSGSTAAYTTISSGATLEFLGGTNSYGTVFAGGTQIVASGYVSTSATMVVGGRQVMIVSSGGSTVTDTVSSGGTQIVSSGGADTGTIISAGGIEIVSAGGVDTAAVVLSGGTLQLVSGGVVSGATVSAGGVLSAATGGTLAGAITDSGVLSGGTIANGGILTVNAGGSETGTTILSGGVENVLSGGSVGNTTIDGGMLDLRAGAVATGSTIAFTPGVAGTLEIDGTTVPTLTVSGFSTVGDGIVLGALPYTVQDKLTVTGNTVTVTNGVSTYNVTVSGASASTLQLVSDAGLTEIVYAPCFLPGTRIATPDGERTVESLAPGETVSVLVDGAWIGREIAAVGRGSMDVDAQADPASCCPVRIHADAFAPGVPVRDLLVTPEHCVFHQGVLIPARMLVNNRSIVVDQQIRQFEFLHVELAQHGILLSEGLTTESYLDTGNRTGFDRIEAGVTMAPAEVMVAPLAVDRATVEPIWHDLARRADAMSLAGVANDAGSALTTDPLLRLLLDDGYELAACWHDGMRYMFHVPNGARVTRMLSRAAMPADIDGAFCDDRRHLGVAVEQVVVWNGLEPTSLDLLAYDMSQGWHGLEGRTRWTNGNATLDLPEAVSTDTFVDLTLTATMRYRLASDAEALAV